MAQRKRQEAELEVADVKILFGGWTGLGISTSLGQRVFDQGFPTPFLVMHVF